MQGLGQSGLRQKRCLFQRRIQKGEQQKGGSGSVDGFSGPHTAALSARGWVVRVTCGVFLIEVKFTYLK